MTKSKPSFSNALRLSLRSLRLWYRLAPGLFWSILFSLSLDAISPYILIWCSAQIIDELAGPRDPQRLWQMVLLTLVITALMTLLNSLCKRWMDHQNNLRNSRCSRLYTEHLLDMDFSVLDRQDTYDLLDQIRQNQNWGNWGLNRALYSFRLLVGGSVRVIGAIVLTVSLFTSEIPHRNDWLDYLDHPAFILTSFIVLLGLIFLSSLVRNSGSKIWAESGRMVTFGNRIFMFFGYRLLNNHGLAMDQRIYSQEKLSSHYFMVNDTFGWKAPFGKLYRRQVASRYALASGIDKLFTGIVYIYVCLKAWAGAFGIGAVTQYIGAITAMSQGILDLLTCLGEIQNNASYLETTFEFLDLPHEMYQGSLTTEKRSDRQYQVEFRDVSFKYPGSDQWALRHVNMKFEVGRRLAVVGQNGSGKTTFIKLLCRLYDPTEGQILLNGIDIRKYNYQDYLDIFSVVFQDFQLLAFTLGENVAAAKDYDAARAEDCLRKAGFGDRLDRLPDGLNTYLYREFSKQGVEISGGEAQKIAIARALYADAPFIILDEPTAALDPIAEAEIYSKFDEIAGDKTAIYISHRLSSCRFCDDILVFDQGQVIQQGSHEELVADETGKYHALWHAQAQYYTKG